nr:EAL domain-containing protein [Armatimonadota bacterium]
GFLRMVSRIIQETGVDPRSIQFEMTENMVMQYVDDTITKLHALREMGIDVSIDDFGTGYSSLGYLRQFDISALKIDKCFVQDIQIDPEDHPNDTAIVRAIIALAHSLNVTVLAEGVETEVQARFLKALECDEAQGYYVGLPLPSDEMERLLLHPFMMIDRGSVGYSTNGITGGAASPEYNTLEPYQ